MTITMGKPAYYEQAGLDFDAALSYVAKAILLFTGSEGLFPTF